jgi:hypothetical protein
MRIYVDETLIKIQKCVAAKQQVSEWIRAKLQTSIHRIIRCLNPEPRLNGTIDGEQGYELWLLFEQVPAKDYLPAFQQKHAIKFKIGNPAPCTCECPYFTSTRLPCSGLSALFAKKGMMSIEQMCPYLFPMWLVKNHPLYSLAMQSDAQATSLAPAVVPSLNAQPPSAPAPSSIVRQNADALRQLTIPTDVQGRRQYISTLWEQVLPGTVASAPLSRELAECLVQHRAKLGGATSLFTPPTLAITHLQQNSGKGPQHSVANLANTTYRRTAKNRVSTARALDPSCYSVHKLAAPNQPVRCLCGEEHMNNNKAAYAHRQKKEHQAWLARYKQVYHRLRQRPVYLVTPAQELEDGSGKGTSDALDARGRQVYHCLRQRLVYLVTPAQELEDGSGKGTSDALDARGRQVYHCLRPTSFIIPNNTCASDCGWFWAVICSQWCGMATIKAGPRP